LQYSKEEREGMLKQMESASGIFYRLAQQTHVHQFLEVTGFLNELIKAYRGMHEQGKDFGTQPLEMKPHEMAYVAEKLDCIFGEALADKKNREAFMDALAEKGGWTWR
jgi:hypothetical protein